VEGGEGDEAGVVETAVADFGYAEGLEDGVVAVLARRGALGDAVGHEEGDAGWDAEVLVDEGLEGRGVEGAVAGGEE
jgi:hypothetical protein